MFLCIADHNENDVANFGEKCKTVQLGVILFKWYDIYFNYTHKILHFKNCATGLHLLFDTSFDRNL